MVYLELAAVALLWGLVPLVMQWSSQELHAGTFNLLRYGAAIVFLPGVLWLSKKSLRLVPGKAIRLMLLGAGTMFPFSYFFLLGVKEVDIAIAGMIQGTTPALTVLAGVLLFGQRPSRSSMLGILVTYLGLAGFLLLPMLTQGGLSNLSLKGLLDVVVAIVAFALYTLYNKRLSQGIDNLLVTFYVCLGVFLACLPFSWYEFSYMSRQSLTTDGLIGTLYMSLFASVLCLILYTKATQVIGPFQASLVTNLVPIIVVISGIIALHEQVSITQAAAMLVTLTGVYLTIRAGRVASLSQSRLLPGETQ